MSMKPGATTCPVASISRLALPVRRSAIAADASAGNRHVGLAGGRAAAVDYLPAAYQDVVHRLSVEMQPPIYADLRR